MQQNNSVSTGYGPQLRRGLRWAIGFLVLIPFVYVSFVLASGVGSVSVLDSTLSPRRIALVIALVLLGLIIRAARWCYFLHSLNVTLPFLPSIVAFLASFSLTATPGKAGELIKSVLLRNRYNVPVSQTAGVLIVERVGDLTALVLLGAVGLTLFVGVKLYFAISIFIIAMAYACFHGSTATKRLSTAIARRFGQGLDKLTELHAVLARLFKPTIFIIGLVSAVAAWGCEALAFYVLTLPVEVPLRASVSIFALSSIAGALSMLPGGLGGFEAAMVVLLLQAGVASTVALTIVATFRLCTIYLATLLGVGALAVWRFTSIAAANAKVAGR